MMVGLQFTMLQYTDDGSQINVQYYTVTARFHFTVQYYTLKMGSQATVKFSVLHLALQEAQGERCGD